MKLTIEDLQGVWCAKVGYASEFADALEELLLKLAPSAPEEHIWHAAEVLGAILGAEVVEAPQINLSALYEGLLEIWPDESDPDTYPRGV